MNKQKWILLGVALVLMGGTAGLLAHLQSSQKLGAPGVRTTPIEGSIRLRVEVPERVGGYESEWVEVDEVTLGTLPADTSFGQRRYTAPDGFWTLMNVVLMGRDRSSLHKPQFCLTGQGWNIDANASLEDKVVIERPHRYEMPIVRLVASKQLENQGQSTLARGVYVYWFVADDAVSASVSGLERMWLMASRLIRTGILQRWAYVSCFSVCEPGQEEATYQRLKQFVAAVVPDLHLAPRTSQTASAPTP